MSHDSFFPAPPAQLDDDAEAGFWIEAGRYRLTCLEVRGFDDALEAARDRLAPAPARLVITGLDDDTVAWLERWAEDTEQVRRALSIRRADDGAEIAIIATLASYGFGVPTSLAVESVRARPDAEILRSGVHLRIDVEAMLARYDAEIGSIDP